MQQTIAVGRNIYRSDQDLVFLVPDGELAPDAARQLVELLSSVKTTYGRCFVLADMEKAGAIPPESRRFLAERGIKLRIDAVAFCREGLLARTMNALMLGTMRLLGNYHQNTKHFTNPAHGMVWLLEERQRLYGIAPSDGNALRYVDHYKSSHVV